MTDAIVVEQLDEGITQVVLNRPDRRNALDAAQWEALTGELDALATSDKVACLVVTGAGSAFASGGDIDRFLDEVAAPDGPRAFRERVHACLAALAAFPAPTIAKVNGPAIGGGMELATACDVRIAARRAAFAIPAVAFGMVMALPDFLRLAATVGVDQARYLTMTGASIDADEAYRIGLVHQVVDTADLDGAAAKVARRLSGVGRDAALWFRRAAETAMGPPGPDLTPLRLFEQECLTSDEFRARVSAFLERRR